MDLFLKKYEYIRDANVDNKIQKERKLYELFQFFLKEKQLEKAIELIPEITIRLLS